MRSFVQKNDDSLVLARANQSPDALLELQNGRRKKIIAK